MDYIDHVLLGLIQTNGRGSYASYGKRVGLSATAMHDRLKKLAQAGVLKHWSAVVSAIAAGYPVLAFIRIKTDLPSSARALAGAVAALPEVLEYHHTGSEWNCLIKVRAVSSEALDTLVEEQIAPFPGIVRLQVERVTASSKESHILPTLPTAATIGKRKSR